MEVEIIQDVYCSNEYAEAPFKARITLDGKLVRRAFELRAAVRKHDACRMEDWGWEPELLDEDEDGNLVESSKSTECWTMVVDKDDLTFIGYVKHAENAEINTGRITFKSLRAWTCPRRELPALITDEDDTTRMIAEARLKKEKE